MSNLPESELTKIWQHQLLSSTEMATEDGEPIEIIYPGRINDDKGADFRGAVIAIKGELIRGDIELHVKSSSWQAHRHDRDPLYNRVILHVVMWHDTKTDATLQNGENIPTLELFKYVKSPIGQQTAEEYFPAAPIPPCLRTAKRLPLDRVTEFLDNAGEERFLIKTARFQSELARNGPGQALYQGIMGALGYSKNKLPFLELARRLPLQILEAAARGKTSDEECLAYQQALLLGTAGLLPYQCQDRLQGDELDSRWVDKLERIWISSPHPEPMSQDDWHLFKVRPNNSPVRRILAMSYLLLRYKEKGILEEIIDAAKEIPNNGGPNGLEKGLLVSANGYRSGYFNFHLNAATKNPTFLGRRRAADIAVNVLLPFTLAWGKHTSQPNLEKKAIELYHGYPRLAVNTVERHMRIQLGLSNRLVNSARRQQGLIHICDTLCIQGRCHSCPFNPV